MDMDESASGTAPPLNKNASDGYGDRFVLAVLKIAELPKKENVRMVHGKAPRFCIDFNLAYFE